MPLRHGSCDGLRLPWVNTSQSASLRGLGILPRALLAGLDPELRERCTDLGLDPILIPCVPAVGEAPDMRWRGSAGATARGKPLGGDGVRRGEGSWLSSSCCCLDGGFGRKAGTAVLRPPVLDMRSFQTPMSGDLMCGIPSGSY